MGRKRATPKPVGFTASDRQDLEKAVEVTQLLLGVMLTPEIVGGERVPFNVDRAIEGARDVVGHLRNIQRRHGKRLDARERRQKRPRTRRRSA